MCRQSSGVSIVVMAVVGLLAHADAGYTQTMSISVYNDSAPSGEGEGEDEYTVYGYSTVQDNSSGCTHGGYYTTTHLTSPSSRHNSTGASGLASTTTLDFAGEEGTWSVATSGSYQCSCIKGGTAGFGGSAQFGVAIAQTHYTGCTGVASLCGCPVIACTEGTFPTCGQGPISGAVKVGPCTNRMFARFARFIWDEDWVCSPGLLRSATGQSGACY